MRSAKVSYTTFDSISRADRRYTATKRIFGGLKLGAQMLKQRASLKEFIPIGPFRPIRELIADGWEAGGRQYTAWVCLLAPVANEVTEETAGVCWNVYLKR